MILGLEYNNLFSTLKSLPVAVRLRDFPKQTPLNLIPGVGLALINILPEKHSIEPPNTPVKRPRSSPHIQCLVFSKPEPLLCTPDEHQSVMSFVHDIITPNSDPLTLD